MMKMMSDEQPEELDPQEMKLHFTKQQRDGDGAQLPDGYLKAQKKERGDTEQLSLLLTMEQAQGWADTLSAQLVDYRKQMQDSIADVDEVYLIRCRSEFGTGLPEVDGVAITKHAAHARRHEIEHDDPMVEVEIEQTPLYTE